jgi:hypothetical protein
MHRRAIAVGVGGPGLNVEGDPAASPRHELTGEAGVTP